MSHGLFDVFAKTVADLPARAIPMALELQCRMLEDDAENRRLAYPDDACSILCFRQFMQKAQSGQSMDRLKPLPPDHIEFFKQTIIRLVQAGELPPSAMELFDEIFVRPGMS